MSTARMLPSGKMAVRFWSAGRFYWQLPSAGMEPWVTLSRRDVAALARFAGYSVKQRRRRPDVPR